MKDDIIAWAESQGLNEMVKDFLKEHKELHWKAMNEYLEELKEENKIWVTSEFFDWVEEVYNDEFWAYAEQVHNDNNDVIDFECSLMRC